MTQQTASRQQQIDPHLREMADYANTLSNIAKSGYVTAEEKNTLSQECERVAQNLVAGIQQNQNQQQQRA